MVANKKTRRHAQSGQSMMEFAILIPLLIGLMALMVEVETVISGAIVGQKYVRQHLHFLFFNSRNYPEHGFLNMKDGSWMSRYWIVLHSKPVEQSPDLQPIAPKFRVGRKKVPNDDELDSDARQNVRLFVSAFVCVPPVGPKFPEHFSENKLQETTFAGGSFPGYCQN